MASGIVMADLVFESRLNDCCKQTNPNDSIKPKYAKRGKLANLHKRFHVAESIAKSFCNTCGEVTPCMTGIPQLGPISSNSSNSSRLDVLQHYNHGCFMHAVTQDFQGHDVN